MNNSVIVTDTFLPSFFTYAVLNEQPIHGVPINATTLRRYIEEASYVGMFNLMDKTRGYIGNTPCELLYKNNVELREKMTLIVIDYSAPITGHITAYTLSPQFVCKRHLNRKVWGRHK